MPSNKSGQKQRSKTRKKTSTGGNGHPAPEKSATSYANLIHDVEGAEGWYPVVYKISNMLEIPDLSSRGGFKKIHENFIDITRNLDSIYMRHGEKDVIAQAVLAIYTRMCADSLLRDRLVNESGLLSKAFALLNKPSSYHVALQALCAITHLGGREVRLEIARRTSSLLTVLETYSDDEEAAELSLTVLSHSAVAVMGNNSTPDRKLVRLLELPRLIRLTIRELQKPTASALLMSHSVPMIATIALHGYKEVLAQSSAVNLLIAFSRASDVVTRSEAVFGIMRLYAHEHDASAPLFDPRKLMSAMNWPPHLNAALMSYGPTRTDVYKAIQASVTFQKAMFKCLQDHDFYSLGRVIGSLILNVEHSVTDGSFEVEDPHTGRRESGSDDLGLPFMYWRDALPVCAKALRSSGHAEDDLLSDYLEFKYMLLSQKLGEPENVEKIERAVKRNPRDVYFYYVLSLCPGDKDCLRAAKKGLSCPNLTEFLRSALLYRSLSLAAQLGLEAVEQSQRPEGRPREEGVAIMKTAWEDAKTFVDCASPDNRNMSNAIDWYIILTLVLYGDETSVDMRELKNVLEKLEIADGCSRHLSIPHKRTQARLTRMELVKRLPAASKEWEAAIRRHSIIVDAEDVKVSSKKAEENLMVWLDTFQDEEDHDHEHGSHEHLHGVYVTHPKVNPNLVELYRCSWCKNPSAVLRKCANCEKARYCDASCQKEHWKAHRKTCKSEAECRKIEPGVEQVQQETAAIDLVGME